MLIPFAFVAALLPVGMYRGLFSQSSEGDFLVDVQPLLLLALRAAAEDDVSSRTNWFLRGGEK